MMPSEVCTTQQRGGLTDLPTAATLILNDNVDGAEEGLAKGSSSFHNVRPSPRVQFRLSRAIYLTTDYSSERASLPSSEQLSVSSKMSCAWVRLSISPANRR